MGSWDALQYLLEFLWIMLQYLAEALRNVKDGAFCDKKR